MMSLLLIKSYLRNPASYKKATTAASSSSWTAYLPLLPPRNVFCEGWLVHLAPHIDDLF
jgi:hypothetical protein